MRILMPMLVAVIATTVAATGALAGSGATRTASASSTTKVEHPKGKVCPITGKPL